jgi:hypothetical protein
MGANCALLLKNNIYVYVERIIARKRHNVYFRSNASGVSGDVYEVND